jgi:hypothetical protein
MVLWYNLNDIFPCMTPKGELELWFVKAFKTIGDMVEQFKTSHMCIVAKILVELDVKEGSVKEIEIMVGNCIYIQALEDKKEDKEAMQIELDAGGIA